MPDSAARFRLPEFNVDAESLPSLKALYADNFDFGTAVVYPELLDSSRMAFCKHQFSIMTAGNEMKPEALLDLPACVALAKADEAAVAVKFDRCTPFLNWCRDNGIKVHGHVLVWHSQTPEAFFHVGYDAEQPLCSREIMLARMERYIQQVLTWTSANYPGLIVSWDVVNEAVAEDGTKLRESNWTKVVGEDFVNRAFEYARKYAAEGIKLFYNDYNSTGDPKLDTICKLLDSLIADGTIDGHGFQCHYSVDHPTAERVDFAFRQMADRNLLIRVSELDVNVDDNSEESFTKQAAYYGRLMRVFLRYADRIPAVQVWGTVDNLSWHADKYPLLFDGDGKMKPAFQTLVNIANQQAD